jgi:hypothetical protein
MVTLPPFAALAEQGIPERELWRFSWGQREEFDPVWDMVLEHSTGFSGAFARQVTLNEQSITDDLTMDLVQSLEQSAREDAIILTGHGVLTGEQVGQTVSLRYEDNAYLSKHGRYSREELFAKAKSGQFVGTLTAHHGTKSDADHPQPAIWTLGPIQEQSGPQRFPVLHSKESSMTISGRYIDAESYIIVNGRRVAGKVKLKGDEVLIVELAENPAAGMHLLQLQTPGGLISNDFIFHVTETPQPAPQPTLGEIVKNGGWNKLLGDWVDVGTRGEFRLSLNWKIKNQLLELTTIDQNGPSISVIRIDPKSHQVMHVGTNYEGATTSGKWDFASPEGPKLAASFVTGGGVQGQLNMQLVPQSDDAMVLRVGAQQMANVQLMRKPYNKR